jgi:hypothetical protein
MDGDDVGEPQEDVREIVGQDPLDFAGRALRFAWLDST